MNLARKIKRHGKAPPKTKALAVERLAAVAIRRGDEVHSEVAHGSHKMLRETLSPWMAPNDEEGFVTSLGRFVDRREAQHVAIAAGQIRALQGRDLLSSDITWSPPSSSTKET